MKGLFFLSLCFINISCFAQKGEQIKFVLTKKHFVSRTLNFESPGVYFRNFKPDTSSNFRSLNPEKVYSISSTIFDKAFIVLLKGNKFLAELTEWKETNSY